MSTTKRPDAPPEPAAERLDARDRRKCRILALGVFAVLLASVLYIPWSTTGPIMCPLRLATGLPCPSCGLTRSFCAMAEGHVGHAFSYHLLGPIFFLAIMIALPVLLYQSITARPVRWFNKFAYSKRLAWVLAIILIGYHLIRVVNMTASGELANEVRASALAGLWRYFAG